MSFTAAAVVTAIVHATLVWLGREPLLLTGQDDAQYMLLARSLSDLSYRDLFDVTTPEHSLYPPGYPALLLVWRTLFGESFDGYVLLNALFSGGTLFLVFLTIRRIANERLALVCMLPIAFNWFLITQAGSVGSEPPFAFFSMLTLHLMPLDRGPDRRLVLAGVAAVFTALIRMIGAALLLAIGIEVLRRRRIRAAVIIGVLTLVVIGGWIGWVSSSAPEAQTDRNYVTALAAESEKLVAEEGSSVAIVWRRLSVWVREYVVLAVPYALQFPTIPGTPVDNVLIMVLAWLGLLPGLWLFVRRWTTAAVYLAASAAILTVWPFASTRFLVPLIPLLLPAMVLGYAQLGSRWNARWGVGAAAAIAAILAIRGAVWSLDEIETRAACRPIALSDPPPCLDPDRASFLRAVHYIREDLVGDSPMLAARAAPLFVYTGRPTVNYFEVIRETELGKVAERLRSLGVRHVLLTSLNVTEHWELLPHLQADCRQFVVEREFPPRAYLLRLLSEPSESANACNALDAYEQATRGRRFNQPLFRDLDQQISSRLGASGLTLGTGNP